MFNGRPLDYQHEKIINDGFWPDLDLADFQKQRSLPPDIDANTQAQALLTAAASVNRQLQTIQNKYIADGIASAADVPGIHLDGGGNALVAQYRVAVFARAKAELLGEFAALGRRATHPGQEAAETRYSLLTESSQAVRGVLGLGRATVAIL